ncbi:MAG: hypothetical protein ABI761_07105 [Saprospiraceae bacterium]
MKHHYYLTIILFHFTGLISAQHYLFPVKTSGYHLAASYSHLNNEYVNGNLWAINGGYTLNGRFTGSLTTGIETEEYTTFQGNQARPISYLLGIGFNYLVLKQEQQHTILSFSVDAGYQYNRLMYGTPGDNASIHTFLYGLSVYRNFHFSDRFSISPSFGLGRGNLHYRHDDSPLGNQSDSYSFPYYNYQLLFKISNFYLSPIIQVSDDHSYLTIQAGCIIPLFD